MQRLLPAFVLALGLFGMPVMLMASGDVTRLDSLQEERETVELEISRLTKRVEHLQAGAREIKSDAASVERVARDQLGLVRQTEVVFQFKPRPIE